MLLQMHANKIFCFKNRFLCVQVCMKLFLLENQIFEDLQIVSFLLFQALKSHFCQPQVLSHHKQNLLPGIYRINIKIIHKLIWSCRSGWYFSFPSPQRREIRKPPPSSYILVVSCMKFELINDFLEQGDSEQAIFIIFKN